MRRHSPASLYAGMAMTRRSSCRTVVQILLAPICDLSENLTQMSERLTRSCVEGAKKDRRAKETWSLTRKAKNRSNKTACRPSGFKGLPGWLIY